MDTRTLGIEKTVLTLQNITRYYRLKSLDNLSINWRARKAQTETESN